jgi:hypothetical protein
MKTNRFYPILTLCILILASLACGGGEPEPTTVPATEPPPPTSPPSVTLGEEQRSEEGGYAFQAVPGYVVEEIFGFTTMLAPGADPEVGPLFVLIGGLEDEEMDPDQLLEAYSQDLDQEEIQVTNRRDVTVDGNPGIVADLSGEIAGDPVNGRMAVVAVDTMQAFVMIGTAPEEEWDEFTALFDAVLDSVTFFEPAVVEETWEEEMIAQWAVDATASSEYGNPDWAAFQATGAPDTDECGDYVTAWASATAGTEEWLELTYATPVYPLEINIYQTYTPDQVVRVELIDTEGNYHEVYTAEPVDMGDDCPYVLTVLVDEGEYQAVGVRITVDQSVIGSWNEIDAVELVGITGG